METLKQQNQINRLKKLIEINSNGNVALESMKQQLKKLENE